MFKPTLYIIGLGIHPTYISYKALIILRKKVDSVFIEKYTSPIPKNTINFLKKLIRKDIVELCRRDLEDLSGKKIFEELEKGKNVALIVPGDPMIATTHVVIKNIAVEKGFNVKVIHGVSIISAIISLLGLSPYRFGPIATITYPRMNVYSMRPYDIVKDNLERNLHTILLLDILENGKFMTIPEAIEILEKLEEIRKENIFTSNRIAIGIARVGYNNCKVEINFLSKLKHVNFGKPPHTIVIPAKLNVIEYESLIKNFKIDSSVIKSFQLLK